jgi:SAM-dependent methyltransferase
MRDEQPMRPAATETDKTHEAYDRLYRGDWLWRYTSPTARLREYVKVKRYILDRFGIPRGARVLEIACGQGYHVDLMRRLGMQVTGVDISREGIAFARHRYPECDFRHLDATEALPFEPESFDLVWSLGAGFFHYSITDEKAERVVRSHLRLVRPGGRYVVMISTDLSGRRPQPPEAYWAREWMHTLDDFRSMLGRHGMPVTAEWYPERRWLPLVGPALRTGWAVASIEKR